MNLYEMTKERQALEDLILSACDENGELNADHAAILDAWDSETSLSIADKLESLEGYRRNIRAEADALKAEAARMTARARTLDARDEALKRYALGCMDAAGMNRLKAGIFSLRVSLNGGKLPLVVTGDVPEEFQLVKIEPDSDRIRAALNAGQDLPFAHLGERGRSLRVA